MQTYRIRPDVSEIEVMRRIRRAGSRCLRYIPGHRGATVLTDKPFQAGGIEKTADWDMRQRESDSW